MSITKLQQFAMKADRNEPIDTDMQDTFPKNELGEISQHIIQIYKRLHQAKEDLYIEREKLITHLQISHEGLGVFNHRKEEILVNNLFTQYANLISDKNLRVAIVNIGAEEEKGNALVKETFPLLKECTDINFVGSIEAREIPHGEADVIVCEAFVGNVILKLYEGLAGTLVGAIKKGMMSTVRSKIGAALALPALKSTLKAFDATQYGGAPLLGLNGLVVKTHGSAKAVELTNSIFQCVTFKEQDINGKIRKNIISSTEQEGM